MKRRLNILLLCIICSIEGCFAQRDPAYSHLRLVSDTLRMDGYTYVCDTIGSTRVNLYNAENHPGRDEIAYKDGTNVSFEKLLNDDIDAIVITDELDKLMWSIVDEAFTKEQATTFGKWQLSITLNISSTTGYITDVYFEYINISNYAKVPVEVYRGIEQRLKNEVQFVLTDEGKRLTYCFLGWSQIPKGKEVDNSGLRTDLGGAVTDRGTTSGGELSTPTIGGLVTP